MSEFAELEQGEDFTPHAGTGCPDLRYSIRQEYSGARGGPRWVARFESRWIGSADSETVCYALCKAHHLGRGLPCCDPA